MVASLWPPECSSAHLHTWSYPYPFSGPFNPRSKPASIQPLYSRMASISGFIFKKPSSLHYWLGERSPWKKRERSLLPALLAEPPRAAGRTTTPDKDHAARIRPDFRLSAQRVAPPSFLTARRRSFEITAALRSPAPSPMLVPPPGCPWVKKREAGAGQW